MNVLFDGCVNLIKLNITQFIRSKPNKLLFVRVLDDDGNTLETHTYQNSVIHTNSNTLCDSIIKSIEFSADVILSSVLFYYNDTEYDLYVSVLPKELISSYRYSSTGLKIYRIIISCYDNN